MVVGVTRSSSRSSVRAGQCFRTVAVLLLWDRRPGRTWRDSSSSQRRNEDWIIARPLCREKKGWTARPPNLWAVQGKDLPSPPNNLKMEAPDGHDGEIFF